jgi:hypothetical protein
VTPGHEELRETLPDYVASRLAPEQRRFVQEHLAGCPACEEIVADLTEMERHVKAAGEAMFEPHPDPVALRRHAMATPEGADASIERHLELCAPCSLEVRTWARRARPPAAPRRADFVAGRLVRILQMGLATSAGAILGVLIGALLFRSKASDTAALRPEEGGPPPAIEPAPLPVGQPLLHILPTVLRSGETPRQVWTLERSEPYLAVAVPVSVPRTASDSDLFRFELRQEGGAIAWSLELTAGRIREHLDAAEFVNIPAIPTRNLGPGTHEFLVRPARPPDAPPIYRATIAMSYRHSPAATNAPQ